MRIVYSVLALILVLVGTAHLSYTYGYDHGQKNLKEQVNQGYVDGVIDLVDSLTLYLKSQKSRIITKETKNCINTFMQVNLVVRAFPGIKEKK